MSKIALQGICFDQKSSFQRGPALAPPLIRQALNSGSMNLCTEAGLEIAASHFTDLGDFKIDTYFDIEHITKENLKQHQKVLSLGGDHSITFPILKAFQEKYPLIDILHIDAHSDVYDSFDNDPYSHACPFARIMEEGLAQRIVQIGIRTLNTHQKEQAQKFNVEILAMPEVTLTSILPFENPLYISLDLDALDPAFAPGVSHHEPGGLTSRQLLTLLQSLTVPVIGADIVEYNPNRDFQDMTAYVAAKMVKEILGKM